LGASDSDRRLYPICTRGLAGRTLRDWCTRKDAGADDPSLPKPQQPVCGGVHWVLHATELLDLHDKCRAVLKDWFAALPHELATRNVRNDPRLG
jgi:hypothetical protein